MLYMPKAYFVLFCTTSPKFELKFMVECQIEPNRFYMSKLLRFKKLYLRGLMYFKKRCVLQYASFCVVLYTQIHTNQGYIDFRRFKFSLNFYDLNLKYYARNATM